MNDSISIIRSRQAGRVIGLLQFLIQNWDDLDSLWIKSKLQEMVKEDAEADKVVEQMIESHEENFLAKRSEIHGKS